MSLSLIKTCEFIEENIKQLQEEKYEDLCKVLIKLVEVIKKCEKSILRLEKFAHKYDYDEETPGNGIRSFIETFELALIKIEKQCSSVKILPSNALKNKSRLNFQKFENQFKIKPVFIFSVIYDLAKLIENLNIILSCLADLYTQESNENNSFDLFKHYDNIYESPMLKCYNKIDRKCFFGKNAGFNIVPSFRKFGYGNTVLSCAAQDFHSSNALSVIKVLKYPFSVMKYASSNQALYERTTEVWDNPLAVKLFRVNVP